MSGLTGSEAKSLMEAYSKVYSIQEEMQVEELALEIVENTATVLFSQGYDVYDLIGYLADVPEKTITEDYIAFSEGRVLIESVTASDEYVDQQFENLRNISEFLISEGIWDSAMKFVGRVASKPARMLAGKKLAQSVKPERTAAAYQKLANQKLTQAGFKPPSTGGAPSSVKFKNTADAARAAAMAKPAGFLNKAASKISGAFGAAKAGLTKIVPGLKGAAKGPLGKFAGKALPVAGAALYGADAVDRLKKGDWGGAALSGAGAVTSLIPGANLVAGLAPAAIQMGTDALGLTGDKSRKGNSGKTPPSVKTPSLKSKQDYATGKGKYYSSSDQKTYKNYNDALAARNSRRGTPGVTPGTAVGAAQRVGGAAAPKAPSAPVLPPPSGTGGGNKSTTPPKNSPAKPTGTGTPMQQWAKNFPKLAARIKPGQFGYDEINNKKATPKQTPVTPKPTLDDLRQAAYQATMAGPPKESQALMSDRVKGILGPKKLQAGIEGQERVEKMKKAYRESYDAYDLVLEYLFYTQQVDSISEAHYIMMEMDSEMIGSIVEGSAAKAK